MRSDFLECIEEYFRTHDDFYEAIDAIVKDTNRCINLYNRAAESNVIQETQWVISSESTSLSDYIAEVLEDRYPHK